MLFYIYVIKFQLANLIKKNESFFIFFGLLLEELAFRQRSTVKIFERAIESTVSNCPMGHVVSKVSLKVLKLALGTVKKINVDINVDSKKKKKKNVNVINNSLALSYSRKYKITQEQCICQ